MESIIATRKKVECFLSVEKYYRGYDSVPSYGYGYGRGFGAGYKDCSGSGSGLSYEDCSGSGSGPGFGYENGSGYGYGDNYGPSYCGFGPGGIKALNGNIVDYIDNVPTIITQVHNNIACGYIVKEDLTLDSCFVAKVGNFFAHGKTLKEAVADAEAKRMGGIPIEERIEKFMGVFGSLDSEYTGKEFYDWHHILTGSCRLGRDKFCKSHNINLTKKYTVKYFLDITKNAYGGDVIKSIREAYKNEEE